MSVSEVLYAPAISTPQELERNRAQTVTLPVYRNGALAAPSSGTYTLYDTTSTAVIDAAAVTVTGNIATYAVLAASLPTTLALGNYYREEWALVMPDATTRTFERDCSVIRKRLYPTISDVDLEAAYTDLARYRKDRYGNWQGFIDEAWTRIRARLTQEGHLPYLIRTPSSLRVVHIELTLALVMRDFHAGLQGETKWLDLSQEHFRAYEAAWSAANWQADYDHDGWSDVSDERERAARATMLNVPPQRWWSRVRGLG